MEHPKNTPSPLTPTDRRLKKALWDITRLHATAQPSLLILIFLSLFPLLVLGLVGGVVYYLLSLGWRGSSAGMHALPYEKMTFIGFIALGIILAFAFWLKLLSDEIKRRLK